MLKIPSTMRCHEMSSSTQQQQIQVFIKILTWRSLTMSQIIFNLQINLHWDIIHWTTAESSQDCLTPKKAGLGICIVQQYEKQTLPRKKGHQMKLNCCQEWESIETLTDLTLHIIKVWYGKEGWTTSFNHTQWPGILLDSISLIICKALQQCQQTLHSRSGHL